MKTILAAAAVLSINAAAPTVSDYGAALATYRHAAVLAEANGPSRGARDTALYAEGESSRPTSGGRDTALYA